MCVPSSRSLFMSERERERERLSWPCPCLYYNRCYLITGVRDWADGTCNPPPPPNFYLLFLMEAKVSSLPARLHCSSFWVLKPPPLPSPFPLTFSSIVTRITDSSLGRLSAKQWGGGYKVPLSTVRVPHDISIFCSASGDPRCYAFLREIHCFYLSDFSALKSGWRVTRGKLSRANQKMAVYSNDVWEHRTERDSLHVSVTCRFTCRLEWLRKPGIRMQHRNTFCVLSRTDCDFRRTLLTAVDYEGDNMDATCRNFNTKVHSGEGNIKM